MLHEEELVQMKQYRVCGEDRESMKHAKKMISEKGVEWKEKMDKPMGEGKTET